MEFSNITVFCFAASYTVALVLGLLMLLLSQPKGKLLGSTGTGKFLRGSGLLLSHLFLGAGLFAHATYLTFRASEQSPPLSSPADWCLISSLLLASIAFASLLMRKKWVVGLFLLPVALTLIGISQGASDQPFSPERASLFWGQIHGVSLLLATVTVSLGFVAGIMYLVQSYRLKQKLAPWSGLLLPSLEWLEQTNARALSVSTWLVAGGFASGFVLGQIRNQETLHYSYLYDPAVWSLAAMLGWLLQAQVFRAVYPAARHGQKVAYLTVTSFLFLLIAIASITLLKGEHNTQSDPPAVENKTSVSTD